MIIFLPFIQRQGRQLGSVISDGVFTHQQYSSLPSQHRPLLFQARRKSSEKYKVNHPHQQFPLVLLLTVELLISNDPRHRLLCKTDIINNKNTKIFYTFEKGLLQLVAILLLLFISLITIMVTLQQIGKEHKVLRSLHNAWKNSLQPKLLKIFLPRDSSSGIKKIYVQNKIVC